MRCLVYALVGMCDVDEAEAIQYMVASTDKSWRNGCRENRECVGGRILNVGGSV